MKSWEKESIKAYGNFVIPDMKNKNDHINLLLQYLEHSFFYVYVCMNIGLDAKHFNLEGHFSKYTHRQFWTARKIKRTRIKHLQIQKCGR